MSGRAEFPREQHGTGADPHGAYHRRDSGLGTGGGNDDEDGLAYAPKSEPCGPGPALDELDREWGIGGYDRWNAYLKPTFAWRLARVLGLKWRPNPIVLMSALQITAPGYRLMLLNGMATRFINWLKEWGVNAYHAEWASPGRLSETFIGPFLEAKAPPTLLFTNWYWLAKYVIWNDQGRDWLDRFHVAAVERWPSKAMRVASPQDVRWVADQIPTPLPPVDLGEIPSAQTYYRARSKFGALHRKTEAVRRADICTALCRMRGIASPGLIDWSLADYCLHWTEHRFYRLMDRVIRERKLTSLLEKGFQGTRGGHPAYTTGSPTR